MNEQKVLKEIEDARSSETTSLYLSELNIDVVPEEIGELTDLVWLYLSENELTSLPNAIANLQKLTWLHLESNQLGLFNL